MSKREVGKCRLTGVIAPLVKSHILPKALTKHKTSGEHFWEAGDGSPAKKKWSSWYDQSILCRKGEDILAEIDHDAITELRKHQLIYSGWANGDPPETINIDEEHGLREVPDIDHRTLWIFFASIVWRASISVRPELRFFSIGENDEDRLRQALLSKQPLYKDFPCELVQLIGEPEIHNATPTIEYKNNPAKKSESPQAVPFARVFIEGVICHFRLEPLPGSDFENNKMFLGSMNELLFYTRPFEGSAQQDRLHKAVMEAAIPTRAKADARGGD